MSEHMSSARDSSIRMARTRCRGLSPVARRHDRNYGRRAAACQRAQPVERGPEQFLLAELRLDGPPGSVALSALRPMDPARMDLMQDVEQRSVHAQGALFAFRYQRCFL